MKVEGLEITIGPHTLPVTVTNIGEFWAEWEGDSYKSETFKGLRAKLMPVVREDAKRCALPALVRNFSGDEFEEITLIGIHGSNGNILYSDENGKTQQIRGRDRRVFRTLSAQERAEHAKLVAECEAAKKRLNQWLRKRVMYPGITVRKHLGLKITERDEPLEPNEDLT